MKTPCRVFRPLACILGMLAGSLLAADGITVSTNGLTWSEGAGDYGTGWTQTGSGVTVSQGDTVYIKYHGEAAPGRTLLFSQHGRKWGAWQSAGPALSDNPVILKISAAGTPSSTMAWINGAGTSGIWPGLNAPGAYDLALNQDSKWTLPPIVVTEVIKPSFWRQLFGSSNQAAPSPALVSVPDGESTAVLLAFALCALFGVRRKQF